jgi:hypothetical protein
MEIARLHFTHLNIYQWIEWKLEIPTSCHSIPPCSFDTVDVEQGKSREHSTKFEWNKILTNVNLSGSELQKQGYKYNKEKNSIGFSPLSTYLRHSFVCLVRIRLHFIWNSHVLTDVKWPKWRVTTNKGLEPRNGV